MIRSPRLPLVLSLLALLPGLPASLWGAAAPPVTLEQIMADPDWIGNPPERPHWSASGRAIYYEQKRQGSERRDLLRLDLGTGVSEVVPPAEKAAADAARGDWSRDRKWKVYARYGDIYIKNANLEGGGTVRQLTRTAAEESEPRFMVGDTRVSFRRGDAFFVVDLNTGLVSQATDIRREKDPALGEAPTYLREAQIRLFDVLRKEKRDRDQAREEERADQKAAPTRPPLPFYLGDQVEIELQAFSPSGDWLVLVTTPKQEKKDARKSLLPKYVTESGNVETAEAREKVGEKPVPRSILLLDLRNHQRYDLDAKTLPGIFDDPLKELRDKAEKAKAEAKKARETEEAKALSKVAPAGTTDKPAAEKAEPEKPTPEKKEPRPFDVQGPVWSRDGRQVALQLHSLDNKDRWLVTVDLGTHQLVLRERLTDPAWINWSLNEFGWMPDSRTLWFLSEKSGYSHLYAVDGSGPSGSDTEPRQLTKGDFEVYSPAESPDGRSIYYRANVTHPGIYEVWRLELASGRSEPLTHQGGLVSDFELSPDGRKLLLLQSSLTRPNELYVMDAVPGAALKQGTHTLTPAFLAVDWTVPEIVPIPSTHVSRPIYSRVYTPPGFDPARRYPGVVFVHGAGYLQEVHYGWSDYWHEFMFHTFLTQHGYVVLDMDYRASAGYGRDWRTAIYRQMGHPELEDLEDGVAWLAAHKGVDLKRVGVYGGSYGGFMTFMALFRHPDLFAAGAALRPVSDWAHYNHDYTSAILNTPEVDPEAYAASSPIEYAAGLARPLLICDGMQDDNVFFQDTVRLVQRLIELKKENFETAIYPVESHGFRQPTSWLDEYRRVWKLFSTSLREEE